MENLIDFLQREQEKYLKIDALARNVLTLSRNTLLVNLRFLDMALSRFEMIPMDNMWATDGHYLLYDPRRILILYQMERELPTRDFLHMVMHCVFRHMFINTLVNRDCWNLACDIAVEASIADLGLKAVTARREDAQKEETEKLKEKVKILTAEKLYHYFMEHPLSKKETERLSSLFKADDHDLWYLGEIGIEKVSVVIRKGSDPGDNSSSGEKSESRKTPQNKGESENGDEPEDRESADGKDGSSGGESVTIEYARLVKLSDSGDGSGAEGQGASGHLSPAEGLFGSRLESDWKNISERMQTDMETFGKNQGFGAGNMMQNLQAVNREKYDYTAFLKKFAVMGEAMKINDDEFDYIFYTYGLQLYKKVPLIEPLEYKDVKRIKEFVIAIDTSGSTSGELVQKFVQKTYNILKNEESFFSKINLHIIQCDADIQEDAKIASQEEFDEYLKHMKLKGMGGTDFRPVFSYVEELIRKKEFRNLKGLIYFTDGWGSFPQKKPDYDTAFVFIKDDYFNPDVPGWAIKLVLQRDEV